LLKNPASGGIPAIANMIKLKTTPKTRFFEPIPKKFVKYLGEIEVDVDEFIKTENVVTVNPE
jgi:hypothetical protein